MKRKKEYRADARQAMIHDESQINQITRLMIQFAFFLILSMMLCCLQNQLAGSYEFSHIVVGYVS
jgi:hypothetical protein